MQGRAHSRTNKMEAEDKGTPVYEIIDKCNKKRKEKEKKNLMYYLGHSVLFPRFTEPNYYRG